MTDEVQTGDNRQDEQDINKIFSDFPIKLKHPPPKLLFILLKECSRPIRANKMIK